MFIKWAAVFVTKSTLGILGANIKNGTCNHKSNIKEGYKIIRPLWGKKPYSRLEEYSNKKKERNINKRKWIEGLNIYLDSVNVINKKIEDGCYGYMLYEPWKRVGNLI